ncbi:MAG: ABC transporter substrate-binding protein [Eubacterium sp.]|nr:ABC transporter substrate-binding protein [Eubacterium sp.]
MRTKFISAAFLGVMLLSSCSFWTKKTDSSQFFSAMKQTGSMELEYATQFTVDYYENGLSLIAIADGESYLLIPEDGSVPENLPEDITVIHQPSEKIYLAASSAMDLFDSLGSLENIFATATPEKDWVIDNVQLAMQNEDILYAGKYSAPDYELILDENCDLAIESTMIYHSPEIKEQLESFGIPVLIERSSYEAHPLGRLEWIKLYGLLLGKEEEAESFFNEKTQILDDVLQHGETGKTAAFFYIGSNGYVNIRKPGDYVSKMIELAGGEYVFTTENTGRDENALSTMNMQFESFYDIAKDADFLIYNGTVDGSLTQMSQLIAKNPLMADFKAVQNGNVWCTNKNMYQQITGAAEMIADFNKIFSGEAIEDDLAFLYRLPQEAD